MSYEIDEDIRREREREERERATAKERQLRKDVQDALSHESTRRVLNAFFATANVDGSAYRDSLKATYHAIGWQDAGGWWLDLIRRHCPEREQQLRNEARKEAREEQPRGNDD